MPQSSAQDVLADTIRELATPFENPEDLRTLGAKLDAVAGALVSTPYVSSKIGENAAIDLSGHVELPRLLRAIDEDTFSTAAVSAEDLLTFSRASIVDFGLAADDIQLANTARE